MNEPVDQTNGPMNGPTDQMNERPYPSAYSTNAYVDEGQLAAGMVSVKLVV